MAKQANADGKDTVKGLSEIRGKKALTFFWGASIVFTALFAVAEILCFPQVTHTWLNEFTSSWHVNVTGINNVAMTVGLTGVIFTWLLQTMEDSECGQPVSLLIRNLFKRYTAQVLLFIIDVILCVYCSSIEGSDAAHQAALVLLAPSVLCGIVSMWILCSLFLFSKEKRREIAFAYLKDAIESSDNDAAYLSWQREMPCCMAAGEDRYVRYFFDLLRRKKTGLSNTNKWRRITYARLIDITFGTNPIVRQKIPAYMRDACKKDDNAYCALLAMYIAVLSDVYGQGNAVQAMRDRELYSFVWYFLTEEARLNSRADYAAICLYSAFYVIYSGLLSDEKNADMDKNLPRALVKRYGSLLKGNTPPSKEMCDDAFCEMMEALLVTNDMQIEPREQKELKNLYYGFLKANYIF